MNWIQRTRQRIARWFGSVEQRADPDPFSLQDVDRINDVFGTGRSTSGVIVTDAKALKLMAFWRGVNLLSATVAKLPCHVRRKLKEGGWERRNDHPAYVLLNRRANPRTNSDVFRRSIMGHVLMRGNGYALIDRSGDGRPRALWLLDPAKVTPIVANGKLQYVVRHGAPAITNQNASKAKITPNDTSILDGSSVLHIRGLSYDGVVGYDVVRVAADAIGQGLAVREYASRFFSNGAVPAYFLEHPGKLADDTHKKIVNSLERMHRGLKRAHRFALLEEGMKANALTFTPEQSQLIESGKFSIIDIALALGVPPHKIGDTSRQGFASLEQETRAFLDDSVDPWLCAFEAESRDKLLTEDEQNTARTGYYTIEHERNALVRADLAARSEALNKYVSGGIMTVNEARAREGLPPIDGGDQLFRPLNMAVGNDNGDLEFKREIVRALAADATIGSILFDLLQIPELLADVGLEAEGDPPELGAPTDERAIRVARGMSDAFRRLGKRISTKAQRAAHKPDEFMAFVEGFTDDNRTLAADILDPAFALADLSSEVQQRLERGYLTAWRTRLLSASAVKATELEQRIKDVASEAVEGKGP